MDEPRTASPDDPRVALIKRLYAGVEEDFTQFAEMTHPESVTDWSRSRGPYMGVYRGRDEVLAFFRRTQEAWGEVEFFHEELIDAGDDRIIRVGGMRARGKESGVDVQAVGAQLFEFKDGLVWRATLFQSKDEALAAARTD